MFLVQDLATLEEMERETGLIDAKMSLDKVMQVDHLARKTANAAIAKRAG